MTPGRVWQQELKHAGERCAGVLVLFSPRWVNARWCQTEFLVADQLGKKIFPIFIAPMPFDDVSVELRTKYQMLDISARRQRPKASKIRASWFFRSREALIDRTCANLLSGGLGHFTTGELSAAPDRDPKIDANACRSPTPWARMRALFLVSPTH